MGPRRFLVTSALPYSNGRLHVGHVAGAYLPADTYVRYLRARGDEVRFVCGSDDNGVSALISAEREGKSVEELTAFYNAGQKRDFAGLGIRFDIYGGTHQPGFTKLHERLSQDLFRRIHEQGLLTKRRTEQLYDEQKKQFLPDRFVKGTCHHVKADGSPCGYTAAYGDQCESCGKTIDPLLLVDPVSTLSGTRPVPRATTHWFLQLGQLQERLERWLSGKRQASGDEPAWRDWVLNFCLGQIKEGLPERAMTRDLDWGVPVPLDDPDAAGKVLYVWFDAPIGYVSFTAKHGELHEGGPESFERWWKDPDCRIVHFIGEDNTVFHALIWPAMLLAEGTYQLPSTVVANKFMNVKLPGRDEEKMSKSRGTAIWIQDYLERLGLDPDPLRYYLTAVAPEIGSTTFDVDDFIARNNGELLNALGNFVNRTVTFAQRYFEGRVPDPGRREPVDRDHLAAIATHAARVTERLERFELRAAMAEVLALARASNGYLDVKAPWTQRKQDLAACGATINVCLQTVRGLATLMAPFLPFSAEQCGRMLGLPEGGLRWQDATSELPAGQALGEPVILFRKLDATELFGEAGPAD